MFSIHKTLKDDCHLLLEKNDFSILLQKNANIPWLICVPHTDKKNFYELDLNLKTRLIEVISILSEFLKSKYNADKINIAEIGNLVPQMHLHIAARTKNDCCWPKPIWGNLTDFKSYSDAEVNEFKILISNQLN